MVIDVADRAIVPAQKGEPRCFAVLPAEWLAFHPSAISAEVFVVRICGAGFTLAGDFCPDIDAKPSGIRSSQPRRADVEFLSLKPEAAC